MRRHIKRQKQKSSKLLLIKLNEYPGYEQMSFLSRDYLHLKSVPPSWPRTTSISPVHKFRFFAFPRLSCHFDGLIWHAGQYWFRLHTRIESFEWPARRQLIMISRETRESKSESKTSPSYDHYNLTAGCLLLSGWREQQHNEIECHMTRMEEKIEDRVE